MYTSLKTPCYSPGITLTYNAFVTRKSFTDVVNVTLPGKLIVNGYAQKINVRNTFQREVLKGTI